MNAAHRFCSIDDCLNRAFPSIRDARFSALSPNPESRVPNPGCGGFTLLEVLIALVVVAVALLALTRTASQQIATHDALRERTLAGWVAANVLAETRLASAAPPLGRSDGRVDFGGRAWRWTREVAATPDADIRRVDVRVFAAEAADPSASLTGFASALALP